MDLRSQSSTGSDSVCGASFSLFIYAAWAVYSLLYRVQSLCTVGIPCSVAHSEEVNLIVLMEPRYPPPLTARARDHFACRVTRVYAGVGRVSVLGLETHVFYTIVYTVESSQYGIPQPST